MDNCAAVYDENNYPVCYVTLNYMEYEKHIKRCHLIAAAPELYEALELCKKEIEALTAACGKGLMTDNALIAASNALSKARGEHK